MVGELIHQYEKRTNKKNSSKFVVSTGGSVSINPILDDWTQSIDLHLLPVSGTIDPIPYLKEKNPKPIAKQLY